METRLFVELEPHILAILGAATAAAGVGLVIWGATAASSKPSHGTDSSLLAPTLAVDTMDPDLRVAYMRTLVFDARLQARSGTRSPLGRELRRCLVALQARIHAGETQGAEEDLFALIAAISTEIETATEHDRRQDAWVKQAQSLCVRLRSDH